MKKVILLLLLVGTAFNLHAQDRLKEITGRFEYLISIKDYQKAKKEIDQFYASQPEQPTELNIVENYEVGRIERRVNAFLEYEERAYSQCKSSSSIERCDNYLRDYPYGKYRGEVLKIKTDLLEKVELADFEKAKFGNTEEVCRQYLSKYPTGKYRTEVNNLLNERIETNLYQKAKNDNTITAYENYIEKYPNGRYATEVNQIIGLSYMRFGDKYLTDRDYSNAIIQYRKYLNKYPNGSSASIARANIKKCEREQRKSGANFLGFYYDVNAPYGLYFGGIKKRGASYYANISFNEDFLPLTKVEHTIDNDGVSTRESGFVLPISPSSIKIGNLSFSNGIAFPIFYPLWGYVGGGLSYLPYMQEYELYSSNAVFLRTEYFRNTDRTELLWYPEAGLKLKLAKVAVLRYGIRYYSINQTVVHQFGLGFQVGQK